MRLSTYRPNLFAVAIAALALGTVAGVVSATPARQDETGPKIYLPLSFRGVGLAELTPAPTTQPTVPTAGPSETPTDTPEPSATPEPSPTPTELPLGSISGRLLIRGQPAPVGLGDGFGPGLYLRRCDGPVCANVARTGVLDTTGRYAFDNPSPLPMGQFYQVTWRNEDSDDTAGDNRLLGNWFGPRITTFEQGDQVSGGEVELEDVPLTEPTNGSGLGGLPWTFKWDVRAVGTDSYQWGICDCCYDLAQRESAWLTQNLGHAGEWTMNSYPPNVRVGQDYKYCWFARINGEGGSYGSSYDVRMLWFFIGLARPVPSDEGIPIPQ